jgi:transposase InsO family protein
MGDRKELFPGMPWKSLSVVQARARFVKLVLRAQQPLAQSCRIFGISRKTGDKWRRRFLDGGGRGLRNRSRRPKRSPTRTTGDWLAAIKRLRRKQRRWGAKKIRACLRRKFPRRRVPAIRTIALWLTRWRLTRRRVRPRPGPRLMRPALTVPKGSNQVWTVDFKGWFRTADGQQVEPLTVRDLFSRYLLAVRLLPDQQWWRVQAVFVRLFGRYGIPKVIRMDNGTPFGSVGPAGLSRLSAWWTVLGIRVEFIAPGHPEQNGSHEQMHREFKADLTQPASRTLRGQQRRSDRWTNNYNLVRPHEALGQRTPAECYRAGRPQICRKLNRVQYPAAWGTRSVRSNGQIRWQGRLRFVGEAFVGLRVGLQPAGAGRHLVYLAGVVLGELRDTDAGGLRPAAYVRQHPSKK